MKNLTNPTLMLSGFYRPLRGLKPRSAQQVFADHIASLRRQRAVKEVHSFSIAQIFPLRHLGYKAITYHLSSNRLPQEKGGEGTGKVFPFAKESLNAMAAK